ncbi:alpha-amylase family glycosyl hydrolase [Actinoplanes sp. TRM 88003]|uniref:Alpha-amylase family glycosyl hydrolase n=1 Tax=Paractinoplanes aksuensis TaxID=2939490 RepID=A0ABT1DLH3_9ACTN|nr:alpha-amylase family glycosyl hydrolase [Actinoplanes aksuensis]MCO8270611.1 alpha-amylase family glycosyl hydrolase [Actinoplanes aksuensis]
MREWVDHVIWWHVYPLGFGGGFRRLTGWLDYAVELGVNGLQLGPIFASETHGYDTTDHFRLDPRLGDDADFDALIAGCRERGLQVMLDGVFNHVGRSFQAPESWFKHTASGERAVFEGHGALVELNHDEPEVLDHVVRVMNHWLDRGATAWRLDVAYGVPPAFWKAAVDRVRPERPEAWFTGEILQGDYVTFLRDSGLDSITQYELWKATWSSLNDGNFFELAWALERNNEVLGAGQPLTFVGNHDVTRIASKLTDERHLGHALAVLFTVGGVPSVYYGDEQGFRGVKEDREGGDDAVRPAFPESRDDLAPYGWPVFHLHQRLISVRRRHPWLVRSRTTAEQLTNEAVALVSADGDNRLVTLLNVGDEPYRFTVDGSEVEVPAHEWKIVGE